MSRQQFLIIFRMHSYGFPVKLAVARSLTARSSSCQGLQKKCFGLWAMGQKPSIFKDHSTFFILLLPATKPSFCETFLGKYPFVGPQLRA